MSTDDPTWGLGPDDVTAVPKPEPWLEQPATDVHVLQPRTASARPQATTDSEMFWGSTPPTPPDAQSDLTTPWPSTPASGALPPSASPPVPPTRASTTPTASPVPSAAGPGIPPTDRPVAPVAASAPPPQRKLTRPAVLAVLVAALLLIVGGGAFYIGSSRSATSQSAVAADGTSNPAAAQVNGSAPSSALNSSGGSASASTTPVATSAPTTDASPTVDPEAAALQQLETIRNASLARLPMDGRWVAQVASKSVGISDPLQTAQSGSHTFYAADILAESLAARQTVPYPDQNVYVVWGTDFGKRSQAPNGLPYWITLVDNGFHSSGDVKAWCQMTYQSLTPAQLSDTCAARQLTPPHS